MYDPIRIQDGDGDNLIRGVVERIRSNDEINEEMIGGEYSYIYGCEDKYIFRFSKWHLKL